MGSGPRHCHRDRRPWLDLDRHRWRDRWPGFRLYVQPGERTGMTTGTEPSVGGFDLAGILAIGQTYRQRHEDNAGKKLYESMHQVPISAPQIPITAGAGTLQIYDGLGPTTGFVWSVRMLNAQGFSAGTINVYRNISGGELLFTFPQAGTFTFGRGEMML